MTRTITITPVLNGYLLQVGCQRVVFEDRAKMLRELDLYYQNPEQVESVYLKDCLNKPSNQPHEMERAVNPTPAIEGATMLGGLR